MLSSLRQGSKTQRKPWAGTNTKRPSEAAGMPFALANFHQRRPPNKPSRDVLQLKPNAMPPSSAAHAATVWGAGHRETGLRPAPSSAWNRVAVEARQAAPHQPRLRIDQRADGAIADGARIASIQQPEPSYARFPDVGVRASLPYAPCEFDDCVERAVLVTAEKRLVPRTRLICTGLSVRCAHLVNFDMPLTELWRWRLPNKPSRTNI